MSVRAILRRRDAFGAVLGLGADAISVEASFFELGGNSLRAVLLSRPIPHLRTGTGWA